jgi:PKD repeat protein
VTVNNLPPTILNVSNDGPQGEGSILTLVVEATDVKNDTLTYAFDWNNDGEFDSAGQSATVSNTWFNQGDYPIRIRVRDKDQGEVFTTTVVSTYNVPPIAIANADSTRFEGDSVAFDASESYDPGFNDVLTYTWRFGDGAVASGINVTHVYADNNVYSTTLTVMDDSGAAGTAFVPVTILNADPVANAGLDRVVDEGVQLELVGTATDPGTADILTYAWDFVYDGAVFDEEASGASGTVTYLDGPAEINVALRVRDDDYNPSPTNGSEPGQAIDTLKVTVENVPPWNVTIVDPPGNPYRTTTGMPVTFRGTGTDVPADPLTYRWDFNYDGLTFDQDATGQVVTYTWQVGNDYQVALRVYDDDNAFMLSTKTVNVGGPPTAVAVVTPTTTLEGRPVQFDGTRSSDPDNDPLRYTWNFGDGSPTSNSITVTHTYTDVGVFTATLRVRDDRGGAATDNVFVSVENIPPTAVVSASPNPTTEGSPVSFDGSRSSAGPYDNLTYEWDFGDGSPLDTSVNATHSYGNNGVYTATLTVADDDNTTSTASVVVNIQDLVPVAVAGPDRTAFEGDPVTLDGTASSDPLGDTLVLYEWDLDYDGANFNVDATGPIVTTSYPDGPAAYTVALRVMDSSGSVSLVDTAQVTVENLPPTAEAGPDRTVSEGDSVTLDGSASSDPGADSLILYEWDFDYDGSNFNVDATGPITTTAYPDGPAAYTIALRVTDDDGAVSPVHTAQVTVNNLPPTADSGGPYVATLNTPITLNGSGSDVPEDILTFLWDLDNDTIFEQSGQAVTYSWTVSGTHTVVLQVSDDDGGVTYSSTSVQVNSLLPIVMPGTFYFLIRGTRYAYLRKRKRNHSS